MPLMPHTRLADKLKSEMRGIDNPRKAFDTFTKILKTYLTDNTVLTYGWAAVSGSGAPDPVVTFKTEITIPGTLMQPPLENAGDDAFTLFKLQFETMMSTALFKHPAGFALVPAPFLLPSIIGGSMLNKGMLGALGNDWEAIMDEFARQIVTSVLNPAMWSQIPNPGNHAGAFVGATAGLVIT